MYAVIRTGGKQYVVEAGNLLDIEKIPGAVGEEIAIEEVLLVANDDQVKIGQPLVAGAKVSAEIVEQKKGKKLTIFKKIRRHGYHLKKGHRQQLTRLRVKEIHA